MGAGGQRHAGDLQPRRLRLPQAECVAVRAQQNPASPKPGSIDVYDWPGRFVETGHAEFYARIRQERWQVEHQQIQATATAAGIAPGHIFTLTNAPFFSDNGEYLVTAAGYHFEENRYASGEGKPFTAPISASFRRRCPTVRRRARRGRAPTARRRRKWWGRRGEYLDGQIWPRESEVPLGPRRRAMTPAPAGCACRAPGGRATAGADPARRR